MSSFEDSPDIILESPEAAINKIKLMNATPLSSNELWRMKYKSRERLPVSKSENAKKYSDSSVVKSYADSEDSTNSNDTSFILDSDLEISNSSHENSISKLRLKVPHTSSKEQILSGRSKLMASTPTFDPATPIGKWRTPRASTLSDDESPVVHTNRPRHHAIIESDSEDNQSPVILANKASRHNAIYSDFEDDKSPVIYAHKTIYRTSSKPYTEEGESHPDNSSCQVKPDLDTDSEQINLTNDLSYSKALGIRAVKYESCAEENYSDSNHSTYSRTSAINLPTGSCEKKNYSRTSEINTFTISTHNIETVDSPQKNEQYNLYMGKYKIKPKRDSEKLNSSNSSVSSNTCQSSVNISTSSGSSTGSLDISNMTQEEIESKIKSNKTILKMSNVNALPDKGARIKEKIRELESALIERFSESLKNEPQECAEPKKNLITSPYYKTCGENSETEINTSFKNESSPEIEVTFDSTSNATKERLAKLQRELDDKKMVLRRTNLARLPDGGKELQSSISKLEAELMVEQFKENLNIKESSVRQVKFTTSADITYKETQPEYQKKKILNPNLQITSGISGENKYNQLS